MMRKFTVTDINDDEEDGVFKLQSEYPVLAIYPANDLLLVMDDDRELFWISTENCKVAKIYD